MDWREMGSRPTIHGLHGQDHRGWGTFTGAYSGGEKIGAGSLFGEAVTDMWDGRVDPRRGWCIALSWLLASLVECVQTFHPIVLLMLDFYLLVLFFLLAVYITYTYSSGDHGLSSTLP